MLDAIASAEVIVIGPSNPIISIRPILNLPGLREAIAASPAPVVAVSPFLAGHAIKGPSDAFMEFAGLPLGPDGALAAYAGVIDGLVSDEPPSAEDPRRARPRDRHADVRRRRAAAGGRGNAGICENPGAAADPVRPG